MTRVNSTIPIARAITYRFCAWRARLSKPLPCPYEPRLRRRIPQMIEPLDSPGRAVLRLNPVRPDRLHENASELRSNQSSLRAGYRGCYAFRTAEGVTEPAPPRDRYSYLGR